jgi:Outer membrane protein beta-barrel domain
MKKMMTIVLALAGFTAVSADAQTTTTVKTTKTKTTIEETKPKKHTRPEYLSIGPEIGFDHSWIGNVNGDAKFKAGGYAGIGLIYTRQSHWGIGAKALFSSEGYKLDNADGYTINVTPLYLRVPLDVYYFFGDYKNSIRPKVYIGPTFGAKLTENYDETGPNDGTLESTTGPFKNFDFGLNAGAGLNIKLQQGVWLNLDLSYYQGLTDAIDDPAGRYNVNHNVAFNAGLLFGIR